MADDFFSGLARGLRFGGQIQANRAAREDRALRRQYLEQQQRQNAEDRARQARGRELMGNAYAAPLEQRLDGNTLADLARTGADPKGIVDFRNTQRKLTADQQLEADSRLRDRVGLMLGAIREMEHDPQAQARLWANAIGAVEKHGIPIDQAFRTYNPQNLGAAFRLYADFDKRLKRESQRLSNAKTEKELNEPKAFASVNLQDKRTGEIIALEKGSQQHREAIASGNFVQAQGTTNQGADFKDAESKAAGFAARMSAAEGILTGLERQGVHTGNEGDTVAGALGTAGNYLMSEEGQQYRQAQKDWVRAKLRRESGAVIGVEEMADEIATYFPMPGDSPKVVEQKRQARVRAMEAIRLSGGKASEALEKVIDPHKEATEEPAPKATGTAPDGVDPELWKFLTPEERALWN